ncbi:MAG: peptide chain release factor N(5)-glutamine methyltransferase [Acidimicrobiaceae bacterium]|nr:peptide chain release factor N(5)-glutamine methyltransferase [Acidimicrobiaceae bacterium]
MTTDPAPATGTLTWRTLWDETSLVTGRPQARWLCEEASGAFGPEFLEVVAQPATERCVAHLDSMLARVRQGEPLQYVLGHWSFRRLDLLVDQRVLIPRPETELVVEVALGCARQAALEHADRPLQLADLGTGSGAIGLSLATELPRGLAEVWLTDVSAEALDVARANTAGLGMAGTAVRFGHGSWFVALPPTLRGQLAVVVSNPPYIAHDDERVQEAVRAWEPSIALFADDNGLAHVSTLAAGSAEWLRSGGWLVVEIGSGQAAAVVDVLQAAGLADVEVRPDLAGHDRIAIARKR